MPHGPDDLVPDDREHDPRHGGESTPIAWWEWPFVVVAMPFLWVWHTLERLMGAVADAGSWVAAQLWRPFAWAGAAISRCSRWCRRQVSRPVRWVAVQLGVPARAVWRTVTGVGRLLLRWGLWLVSPPVAAAWQLLRQLGAATRLVEALAQRIGGRVRALVDRLWELCEPAVRGVWRGVAAAVRVLTTPIRWVSAGLVQLFQKGSVASRQLVGQLLRPLQAVRHRLRTVIAPLLQRIAEVGDRARALWSRRLG